MIYYKIINDTNSDTISLSHKQWMTDLDGGSYVSEVSMNILK